MFSSGISLPLTIKTNTLTQNMAYVIVPPSPNSADESFIDPYEGYNMSDDLLFDDMFDGDVFDDVFDDAVAFSDMYHNLDGVAETEDDLEDDLEDYDTMSDVSDCDADADQDQTTTAAYESILAHSCEYLQDVRRLARQNDYWFPADADADTVAYDDYDPNGDEDTVCPSFTHDYSNIAAVNTSSGIEMIGLAVRVSGWQAKYTN